MTPNRYSSTSLGFHASFLLGGGRSNHRVRIAHGGGSGGALRAEFGENIFILAVILPRVLPRVRASRKKTTGKG